MNKNFPSNAKTQAHVWPPAELRDLRSRLSLRSRSMWKYNAPCIKTTDVFTTANCSIVSAAGIIEDVMIKVGRLVIPTDFYVIKPPPGERGHPQVLLGRPFLKTSSFRLTYAEKEQPSRRRKNARKGNNTNRDDRSTNERTTAKAKRSRGFRKRRKGERDKRQMPDGTKKRKREVTSGLPEYQGNV
ncbi:hypothetical protein PIB30_068392 [Stylosanthes scabra]|uniref:Uncharacterized protein n=1 Tax=Stylosanthes scabra TaxID=79078 RepID=A0ABU6VLA0_9FABA|nr:hypothetical protein [Stylosanthes scabra]